MSREPDLAALEALLAGHREKLNRIIALAEEGGRDRVATRILDSLADTAREYLKAIDLELSRPVLSSTHGSLGWWGENGKAPLIRDMLSSAEFHANNWRELQLTECRGDPFLNRRKDAA